MSTTAPPGTRLAVEPAGGDEGEWTSPTEGTALPYDFVPVIPQQIKAEAPVWHDGSHPKPEELYSGELRCTLTTLTPMIVGNQQFALADVKGDLDKSIDCHRMTNWEQEINAEFDRQNRDAQANRKFFNPRTVSTDLQGQKVKLVGASKKKKLLLPLRASFLDKSPVLIAGESIKGMVRQSLGALMNAPIERIQPASFSYRPNVNVEAGRTRPMAAEVISVDLPTRQLEVRVFEFAEMLFVHHDDSSLFGTLSLPCDLPEAFSPTGWVKAKVRGRQCIEPQNRTRDQQAVPLSLATAHRALRYQFGTAGINGYVLNGPTARPADPHPSVVVPKSAMKADPVTVRRSVVNQYLETRQHLGDGNHGHLARARGNLPKNWRETDHVRSLQPGDVIFCEVLPGPLPSDFKVVSFGHNFRYRWRHLNGVTDVVTHFDNANGSWVTERRPEMRAHEMEVAGTDGRPSQLTAVRNMFGYVIDAKNPTLGNAQPKFKDPFDRMAGRISFNFAMERVGDNDTDATRFVSSERGGFVFLHPTVEPKPQFGRSYVPGEKRGWGGGLLEQGDKVHVQGSTKWFAGRKFYPHQGTYNPQTRLIELGAEHYDLIELQGVRDAKSKHTRWELLTFLWGDQAQIARHVSAAGRPFGFTVRFKSLRAHELAALAAALSPDLVADVLRDKAPDRHKRSSQELRGNIGVFANKLGHGRALGLGSVRVHIDSLVRWPQMAGNGPPIALTVHGLKGLLEHKLLPTVHPAVLHQWLNVHKVSPSRAVKPYLFAHEGQTMVKWCTSQRNTQLKKTRADPFPGIAQPQQAQAPHAAGAQGPGAGGGGRGQGSNRGGRR